MNRVKDVSAKIQSDAEGVKSVAGVTGVRASGTSLWVDTDSINTAQRL